MQIFDQNSVTSAASCINQGQLVAFPTETVYGLGARADNSEAVRQIFEVKGRPQDNPLIVHVASIEEVEKYVAEVTPLQRQLMEAFWPGPLTLIFPLKEGVFAPEVNGGQETIAIRMPKHPLALALIKEVGFPLVGPSANRSGKPSPTLAEHVIHDFSEKIAGVLTGANEHIEIGLESTVLHVGEEQLTILRPGWVTASDLKEVTALPVVERQAEEQLKDPGLMSPGVKYRHYSPEQPVVSIQFDHSIEDWKQFVNKNPQKIGIIAEDKVIEALKDSHNVTAYFSYGKGPNIEAFNQLFYEGLRYLEQKACDVIYVQSLPTSEASEAYLNRLSKASSYTL